MPCNFPPIRNVILSSVIVVLCGCRAAMSEDAEDAEERESSAHTAAAPSLDLTDAVAVKTEAVVGKPLGVAKLVMRVPHDAAWQWRGDVPVSVTSPDGRLFYPAFSVTDEPDDQKHGRRFTTYLLFRGDQPFQVRLAHNDVLLLDSELVEPAANELRRKELLNQWPSNRAWTRSSLTSP